MKAFYTKIRNVIAAGILTAMILGIVAAFSAISAVAGFVCMILCLILACYLVIQHQEESKSKPD